MTAFKLDENLPVEATALFRAAGLDAMSVAEQALAGHADDRIAEVCRAEGRALVTLDLDFSNVRVFPPASHPGIVVLRPRTADKPSVLSLLGRALPSLVAAPLVGALWIVEEQRIRQWTPRRGESDE